MTTPLKIEVGKFYRTRDGQKRRVICVDSPRKYLPVVALDEFGFLCAYTASGIYLSSKTESCLDLISPWIEAPNPGEGWRLLEGKERPLATDEIWVDLDPRWDTNHKWHLSVETAEAVQKRGIFFRRRIRPVVDWAAMPKWAQWVAQHQSGTWCWFDSKPKAHDSAWYQSVNGLFGGIPNDHSPTFTGSWKDSLVSREEAGR